MAKIRILIADDHALLREGIRAILSREPDLEVVGEAADGREAVERSKALQPDIVLMDIAMPGLGGLEAAIELRRDCPRVKVLVLTQYEDREYVTRFLKAGAAGYVLKKAVGAELASAVRSAAKGGLVLDPQVAREALREPEPPGTGDGSEPYDALTDREKQVLKLVAEGKSNKEVAALLAISVKTAMSHRERVMEKLGLHNRTDLI
ncbi:MAG TPA: response regulator transcription factor, partial [Thermoanaerobaculia bacterium]|nr:response regulator transcription factor [Thermoanaerobaculia bacterium]